MTGTTGLHTVLAVATWTILSWITISPGVPTIYAPLNLLVLVPAMLIGGRVAAVVLIPLVSCLWCRPVFRGRPNVPVCSVVLLVVAVILSALNLAFGFDYASHYHGLAYAVTATLVNVSCWIVLGVVLLWAMRCPSSSHNLAFHVAMFAWLAWYAFPYLGELP
ncbi:MAG: hypothetical protein JW719_02900 [Pirellulales bacterium]|nr:hypothetical protein [Pirellulales bacterium]